MQEPNILIVEDEAKIRSVLRAYLVQEGYTVVEADRGDTAIELFNAEQIDLVLLDLMLPGLSGEQVAAKIRQTGSIPIIMITAREEEWERLKGFELGADDYIVKPFSPREVMARVKAVLKRSNPSAAGREKVEAGSISIDQEGRQVYVEGRPVKITATEFDLLVAMASHPGRVFRRSQLASLVLGYDHVSYERTIDSHIKNLRKKLGSAGSMIETVFGVGYKVLLSPEGQKP
jgi:two-component system, OmpR family, response regulator ResD